MCHIQWHPCAENILASAASDGVIIIWNVEAGEIVTEIEVTTELIQSICWDYNGSRIALTSKDKKIRIVDPRTGELIKVSECIIMYESTV